MNHLRYQLLGLSQSAVRNGAFCPTNRQLADRLGLKSTTSVVHHLRQLEREGRIRIERFSSHRVVTLLASGRKTAVAGGATGTMEGSK